MNTTQLNLIPAPQTGWPSSIALRVFAVLAVAVGLALWQPWRLIRSVSAATDAAAPTSTEVAKVVTVTQPEPAAATEVVLPATVRPWQTTVISARANGYLKAWHKDLGATVRSGELLAEIETPELDQEVAEGEAAVVEARAAVVQAQAERQEAEAQVQVAEAQLQRFRAEAELARSQLLRREQLLLTHAISEEEHDTFRKAADARAADVVAAEADVVQRRRNLATRDAIIAARQATEQSRVAAVARLKQLQSFQRLTAPFDGVVTSRTAEVGMLVTAGKEALFTLEDMSRVRVQVSVPQAYSGQTVPGAAAKVNVPESSTAAEATVTRIADRVDPTNRTMLAEIELDNAARRFQPGSYVQVTLTAVQDASSWTIPTKTLQMRVDGPHVAVVGNDQRIEIRRVTLGRNLGQRVVVSDGIRGGESVVVNPSDDLRNDMLVQSGPRSASSRDVAHAASGE